MSGMILTKETTVLQTEMLPPWTTHALTYNTHVHLLNKIVVKVDSNIYKKQVKNSLKKMFLLSSSRMCVYEFSYSSGPKKS